MQSPDGLHMHYAPEPTQPQLDLLAEALSPDSRAAYAHRILGGLGCTMDVFDLHESTGATRRLVLRRYGPWSASGDVPQREFASLHALANAGVPVPEPIWQDESGIFDERAVVISFIEGKVILGADASDGWAEKLAAALAQVHATPVDEGLRAHLVDRAAEQPKRLKGELPGWYAPHTLGHALWEGQKKLYPATRFEGPTFLHSDFWPGQVMWRDGEVVAVVDWEDAGYGDPALDVAYCANDLRYDGRDDTAMEFIDAYRRITGRALESLPYWTLVALGRPMPDIARWLPSWQDMGSTTVTADTLRARHNQLIEEALAGI